MHFLPLSLSLTYFLTHPAWEKKNWKKSKRGFKKNIPRKNLGTEKTQKTTKNRMKKGEAIECRKKLRIQREKILKKTHTHSYTHTEILPIS